MSLASYAIRTIKHSRMYPGPCILDTNHESYFLLTFKQVFAGAAGSYRGTETTTKNLSNTGSRKVCSIDVYIVTDWWWNMYIRMCIHTYVYVYVYTYTYVYVYVYTYTYVYVYVYYVYTYMYVCVYTYMYICVYMYILRIRVPQMSQTYVCFC